MLVTRYRNSVRWIQSVAYLAFFWQLGTACALSFVGTLWSVS